MSAPTSGIIPEHPRPCPTCEARIAAAETARNAGEVGVMTREIDGRTWFALETPERDL